MDWKDWKKHAIMLSFFKSVSVSYTFTRVEGMEKGFLSMPATYLADHVAKLIVSNFYIFMQPLTILHGYFCSIPPRGGTMGGKGFIYVFVFCG